MKFSSIFSLLVIVLIILGCSQPQDQVDDRILKRIQELENKVDDLKTQLNDQKIKTRISFMQISSNPGFITPFEDFVLASDDYWNNIVDVGLLECSRSCTKAAKKRQQICAGMADGPEKKQCYEESAKRARSCQKSCQTSFPPKFK